MKPVDTRSVPKRIRSVLSVGGQQLQTCIKRVSEGFVDDARVRKVVKRIAAGPPAAVVILVDNSYGDGSGDLDGEPRQKIPPSGWIG